MKSLKDYIFESRCECSCTKAQERMRRKCSKKGSKPVKESSSATYDMTYPWCEGGQDRNYDECTEDKYLVKNGKQTKAVLKALEDLGDQLTGGDGAAYAIQISVGGKDIVGYLPENELWCSDEMTGAKIASLLKSNSSAIVDAIEAWCDDMNFSDDPDDCSFDCSDTNGLENCLKSL